MRVKLIHVTKFFRETFPPYGLSLINAFLHQHNIESDIFDLDIVVKYHNSLEDKSLFSDLAYIRRHYDQIYYFLKFQTIDSYFDLQFEKMLDKIDLNGLDVVGLSCHDNEIYSSLYLARKIKERIGCTVVIGGTHIIRMSYERLKYFIDDLGINFVDYFVIENQYEFFLRLKKGELKKITSTPVIFPNQKGASDFLSKYASNITDVGIPLYNKEHINLYRMDMKRIKHFYPKLNDVLIEKFSKLNGEAILILPYMFTWGCPLSCTFCFASLQKFKKDDLDKTLSRIQAMKEMYNCNNFFFLNDNIISDKKYAITLFEQLRDGIGIRWCDSSSIRGLDEPTLKLMSDAGCIQLLFGLESASQKMLKYVDKNNGYNELDYYTQCFKDCDKNNIWVVADLIAGLPYETDEDVENSIYYLEQNRELINGVLMLPFAFYKTSLMYKEPEKYGLEIVSDDVLVKKVKADFGDDVDVYRKIYYRTILFNETHNGLDCWEKQRKIRRTMQFLINYVKERYEKQIYTHYPIFYIYNLFNGDKKAIRNYLT